MCERLTGAGAARTRQDTLDRMLAGFELSELEQEWLKRGRNASSRGPRRLNPKTYRAASAFETLVGYLHLRDQARLEEIFEFVWRSEEAPGAAGGGGGGEDGAEDGAQEGGAAVSGSVSESGGSERG